MLDQIFNLDNPFFRAMSRVADLFVLNLLFLITCIPIITIGTSISAMIYTCYAAQSKEDGYIAKRYLKSFKDNLKQGIILWLIFLLIGFIFAGDDYFWISLWVTKRASYASIFILVSVVFTFLYLMILIYVFAVQAKFQNTIKDTIRNAFVLSIRHFPLTLLLMTIPLIMATVVYYFAPVSIVIFGCLGFGTTAYIMTFIYRNIFKHYMPKEAPHVDATESMNLASEMMELARETLDHEESELAADEIKETPVQTDKEDIKDSNSESTK